MNDLKILTKKFESQELKDLLNIGIDSEVEYNMLMDLMEELLPQYYEEDSLEYQSIINILNKISFSEEKNIQ